MFPVASPPTTERLCAHGVLSWKFPKSLGSYTLIGRSRAADATSLFIPELNLLLDCGCVVTSVRPSYIFITHTHSDHCFDIPRLLSGHEHPKIFLPTSAVQPMTDVIDKCKILLAAGDINSHLPTSTLTHQLIGVQPDDIFDIGEKMKVRVFEMDHSVPCCGYGFYETRQKLKKEYEHLTGKEIGQLRRADKNLVVSDARLAPQFAFLGDTTASIFEKYQNILLEFPLIIVECSFIDQGKHGKRAADVKHILWDDLRPYVIQHPEITFVLIHFSQQYKTEEIKEFFQKLNLPNVVPFV